MIYWLDPDSYGRHSDYGGSSGLFGVPEGNITHDNY